MDKYTQIYLDKLGFDLGGLAKSLVVDPAVGMFTNTGGAIGSAIKGDWSDAGSKALKAIGNTIDTGLNASFLIPGIGTGIGLGGKALVGGGKGLFMGLNALSKANKAKGLRIGLNTVGSAVGTAGGRAISISNKMRSGWSSVLDKIQSVPGHAWIGFGKTPGKMLSRKNLIHGIGKPLLLGGVLEAGSQILGGQSHLNKMERLMQDPEFQKYVPRHLLKTYQNSTNDELRKYYQALESGGYVRDFESHRRNLQRKQQEIAARQERAQIVAQQRAGV